MLLLLSFQLVEVVDDLVGLAAFVLVRPDGFDQIRRASVMKEEDALPDAPEWGGPELVGAGGALGNAVGKAYAHVVDEKVREEIYRLIGKGSTRTCGRAAGNLRSRGE